MSWLNLRGEIVICPKCKKEIVKCEFVGGNMDTQIGDFSVMEQLDYNKKYNTHLYNPEIMGYYYYSFGICEECLDKKEKGVLKVDDNFFYVKWLEKEESLDYVDENLLTDLETDTLNNLTEELIQNITPIEYEKMINEKTLGSKKKLNSIISDYAAETKGKWIDYFCNRIIEIKMEITGKPENIELDKMVRSFISENKSSIYLKREFNGSINLNEHIMHENTIRQYEKVEKKCDVYNEIWYDKKEIESLLNLNHNDFCLDRDDFEYQKDYFEHAVFKPLRELMIEKLLKK